MIRSLFRFLTIPSLLIGLATSGAQAQFVVHDPVNGVILIDQKLNQLTQIKNEVAQLQYQLQNLKPYNTNWSGLLNQVEALRTQIVANAPTIVNANAQLSQMNGEIAALQQLQAMSNGAQGSMQVAQTTNSLIATVVGQMQKQRALTINAIQEEERNKAAAYAALYGPSQMSK